MANSSNSFAKPIWIQEIKVSPEKETFTCKKCNQNTEDHAITLTYPQVIFIENRIHRSVEEIQKVCKRCTDKCCNDRKEFQDLVSSTYNDNQSIQRILKQNK